MTIPFLCESEDFIIIPGDDEVIEDEVAFGEIAGVDGVTGMEIAGDVTFIVAGAAEAAEAAGFAEEDIAAGAAGFADIEMESDAEIRSLTRIVCASADAFAPVAGIAAGFAAAPAAAGAFPSTCFNVSSTSAAAQPAPKRDALIVSREIPSLSCDEM